jgi:hypothetical protein
MGRKPRWRDQRKKKRRTFIEWLYNVGFGREDRVRDTEA